MIFIMRCDGKRLRPGNMKFNSRNSLTEKQRNNGVRHY